MQAESDLSIDTTAIGILSQRWKKWIFAQSIPSYWISKIKLVSICPLTDGINRCNVHFDRCKSQKRHQTILHFNSLWIIVIDNIYTFKNIVIVFKKYLFDVYGQTSKIWLSSSINHLLPVKKVLKNPLVPFKNCNNSYFAVIKII